VLAGARDRGVVGVDSVDQHLRLDGLNVHFLQRRRDDHDVT
jgi:hypothetical protein